nr:ABC transporter permease [candidate division Zixibacteria bacterium]
MKVFKLIFKNAARRKLRAFLTILGIALAVMAFGLIRTFIDAWYAGARAAQPDRLVTRHAVSIVFDLPIAYKDQILSIDGVEDVTYAIWFGGIYIDPSNFFPQMGVEPESFFRIFPEFILARDQLEALVREKRGAVVGRKVADRFGWKIGDKINLIGTIYPGNWEFIITGIYTGRDVDTDETMFLFRFDYVDEVMKQESPGRVGEVGWYALKIDDPSRAAEIASAIDRRFDNSWAETKTETEKQFQLSFISMAGAIIVGLRIISYLIIGVILLVMINTMAMTARERVSENAFMRTLGFRGYHLTGLILGESLIIAAAGGITGMGLLYLVSNGVRVALSQYFPGFEASLLVYMTCLVVAILVGIIASIFPVQRALRISIVDGLRVVD